MKPKILIVDDKPQNLYVLERLLNKLDVEVHQTTSGMQALGMALENDFCVAIVDIQMPEMDGYELVELLRGNNSTSTLPVIFVSAVYSDEYHHRKAYDAGAVDFMSKPYIPEILLSKVKVFIDLYNQRRMLQELVEQLDGANNQLDAANKELERFAFSISRELHAPLRAVDGYARLLADDYAAQLPPDALEFLQNVRQGTGRMHNLIDGLLQFSRLGLKPVDFQPVSMSDLAQKALDELKAEDTSQADEPRRQVSVTIGDLPQAIADPFLLQQVFLNLLSNALKFTRTRPQAIIDVGSMAQGSQVVYFVRDNGVGFDMQQVDRLFGVFQRLHSPDQFEGLGIGLANVQRIISRHAGKIWAQAAVDQGATFFFTLSAPASASIPAPASNTSPDSDARPPAYPPFGVQA